MGTYARVIIHGTGPDGQRAGMFSLVAFIVVEANYSQVSRDQQR